MFLKKFFPEKAKRQFRIAESILGGIYYRTPSKDLKLIGVTGTSGKSTTSHLIYHVLKENGVKVGLISTVKAEVEGEEIDTGLHVTTPDPIQMQKLLKIMRARNVEYVVVESSSHALAQGRLGKLRFDYAVFTNIKRDHLDWHKTWENYAVSKALLIKSLKKDGVAVINEDDQNSYSFLQKYIKIYRRDINVLTYKRTEVANLRERNAELHFSYENKETFIPLIGLYNIENVLAVLKTCTKIGISLQKILTSLKTFPGVSGRMEVISREPFYSIVNFAHNTDSLEKSLATARELAGEKGKVIVVFGSAGLRDVEKRYTMGETAAKLSDIIIITAEDPRIEKLYDINSQILEGAERGGGVLVKRFRDNSEYQSYIKQSTKETRDWRLETGNSAVYIFDEESVNSRYDAIDFAVKLAGPGDVVLTEGKGHEKSLCFGTTEYPFTDQEAVRRALNRA
jgi:UDP-N-acetylmuramoyl-L-alanyl-D-glutamate--2,6-diaminopimelate ligase